MTTATQKPYEPELGQMAFGNPSGEFELGKLEGYTAEQLRYLTKLIHNSRQAEAVQGFIGGEFGYGANFRNQTFEMLPYYWGDCTCGYEDEEEGWSETHKHDPNCFSGRMKAFREELERQRYKTYSKKWVRRVDQWALENGWEHGFEGSGVHCDCPRQQELEQFAGENSHAPQCPAILPNFRCGDLEIRWYKYIGRGMSVNRQVTREELQGVFRRCEESLRAV